VLLVKQGSRQENVTGQEKNFYFSKNFSCFEMFCVYNSLSRAKIMCVNKTLEHFFVRVLKIQ
jgi:hypothetical protein